MQGCNCTYMHGPLVFRWLGRPRQQATAQVAIPVAAWLSRQALACGMGHPTIAARAAKAVATCAALRQRGGAERERQLGLRRASVRPLSRTRGLQLLTNAACRELRNGPVEVDPRFLERACSCGGGLKPVQ